MLTDFFASDDSEATARRTGFVKRTANMTGKIFLAWVTFGLWHDADTTLAPLAAKVTQWDEQRAVAPEAIYPRVNQRALAFLQDLICQALATVQAREQVGDAGLFPAFTKVSLAASTGFALPKSWHALVPGSGGSATQAGAKMQAVWDYKRRGFAHLALPPGNLPEQKDGAMVVA
jgi:hypothetical protein